MRQAAVSSICAPRLESDQQLRPALLASQVFAPLGLSACSELARKRADRMDWIVTLAEWEMKAPALNPRRRESYWTAVELPLETEFVFIVNTCEERATQTPARSTAITTTAMLVDFLGRVDPNLVSSAYVLLRSQSADSDEMKILRLKSISAGDVEELGWARVLVIRVEGGASFTDPDTGDRVKKWVNETEVFNFSTPRVI